MKVLQFENVSKEYTKDATALKSVSFTFEKGEFAALSGPSGSGKTTILNLAAGLDRPSSGKVILLDQDLSQLSALEITLLRRQHVGFVFQAYNLFPVLTAIENVEYTLALQNVAYGARKAAAKEALRDVGLEKFAHRRPSQLSGGQQQRVAIARAIATKPHIVFADEPTANLDATTTESLLELFKTLNDRRGISFLFSSHDPRVLKQTKRILEVADGELKSDTLQKPNENSSEIHRIVRPVGLVVNCGTSEFETMGRKAS